MDIFGSLLGVPQLPGANCAGQWSLFDEPEKKDPDRAEVIASAIRLCDTCPTSTFNACTDWYESLPFWERPTGVVAGQLRPFIKHPKRKEDAA